MISKFTTSYVFALFGFLFLTPVSASVIYSYTGNQYVRVGDEFSTESAYDTSMFVTGYMELENKLAPNLETGLSIAPISFSFFDGVNTIDETNATAGLFAFETDSFGEIISWIIAVESRPMSFSNIGDKFVSIELLHDGVAFAANVDNAETLTCLDDGCATIDIDVASTSDGVSNSPFVGQWSVVPIPAAIWLFASGFIMIFGWARK